MYKYYLCPSSVAEKANLSNFRKKTPDGLYILNSGDLVTYPLEVAILDGAVEIGIEDAKKLLNSNK